MSKRIMITGGLGFIGSNFVKHLVKNYLDYEILIYDAMTYAGLKENIQDIQDKVELVVANVLDEKTLSEHMKDVDIVFHMAAESHVSKSIYAPDEFVQTDFVGTYKVLEVARHMQLEKLICISTSEVYGTADFTPMTEQHPLNTRSPYAAAKVGADRMALAYYHTYGIPVTIVRPFNNYGAFQNPEKLIPRFIIQAIKNQELTVEGDGGQLRDWLYVEDHCEALAKLMSFPKDGEVINLGTGKNASVLEIADMILKILDKPDVPITHFDERQGNVRCHLSSTDKAEKLLDWKATTDFYEGMEKTVKWYLDNEWWWKPLI